MTIARAAMCSPCVTSRTRSFTRSHERSLLSTARLNRASSRVRFSSWRRMRIAQISLRRNGGLLPDEFAFVPRFPVPFAFGTWLFHDDLPVKVFDHRGILRLVYKK